MFPFKAFRNPPYVQNKVQICYQGPKETNILWPGLSSDNICSHFSLQALGSLCPQSLCIQFCLWKVSSVFSMVFLSSFRVHFKCSFFLLALNKFYLKHTHKKVLGLEPNVMYILGRCSTFPSPSIPLVKTVRSLNCKYFIFNLYVHLWECMICLCRYPRKPEEGKIPQNQSYLNCLLIYSLT